MTDVVRNRFSYSDRDYLSLRDQLVEYVRSRIPEWVPGTPDDGLQGDPSDFATVFIEAVAYMGDMLSYYNDRAAQEATPLTATSLANVLAWAQLFGFTPALAQSAEVTLTLTVDSDSPVQVPHRLPVRSATGYAFEIMLSPDAAGVVPDTIEVYRGQPVEVTAWEGQSIYQDGERGLVLGVSDGSPGQQFVLPHLNIDSRDLWVDVYVDDENGMQSTGDWLFTYRLMESSPSDMVFTVRLGNDRRLYAVFGDGVTGMIPPKGYAIRIYYRLTVGAAANNPAEVPPFSITMVDASWDRTDTASLSLLTVENPFSPTGGTDPDTPDIIKRKTVAVAGAQRRAVSATDYEAAALMHGEVLYAHCTADVWSRPTVWILPKSRSVYEQADAKRALLERVRETLASLAMVGADPDVHLGMPVPLALHLKAYTFKNIRHSAVQNAINNALVTEFSYENLQFNVGLGTEDILTRLNTHVSSRLLRFVVAELSSVYPSQPTDHDPTDPADVLGSQRFLPRPGELLYIDPDNVTITVFGGINDVRTP